MKTISLFFLNVEKLIKLYAMKFLALNYQTFNN